MTNPTLKQMAAEESIKMQCNCDLDNWEPELTTGHSHVCRIHKAVLARLEYVRIHKEPK